MWLFVVLSVVIGYLLGNLNGAVWVSHLLKDDVRSHGSGNAGLTNFIRSYGAKYALLVVAVDALKAVFACLIASLLLKPYGMLQEGAAIGGLSVMLGHVFPVFLGFHGGKGILSGLFVALMVDWRVFHHDNLVVMLCGLVMSVLAIFMHRQNIVRLLKGEERKTDLFKK